MRNPRLACMNRSLREQSEGEERYLHLHGQLPHMTNENPGLGVSHLDPGWLFPQICEPLRGQTGITAGPVCRRAAHSPSAVCACPARAARIR